MGKAILNISSLNEAKLDVIPLNMLGISSSKGECEIIHPYWLLEDGTGTWLWEDGTPALLESVKRKRMSKEKSRLWKD